MLSLQLNHNNYHPTKPLLLFDSYPCQVIITCAAQHDSSQQTPLCMYGSTTTTTKQRKTNKNNQFIYIYIYIVVLNWSTLNVPGLGLFLLKVRHLTVPRTVTLYHLIMLILMCKYIPSSVSINLKI